MQGSKHKYADFSRLKCLHIHKKSNWLDIKDYNYNFKMLKVINKNPSPIIPVKKKNKHVRPCKEKHAM